MLTNSSVDGRKLPTIGSPQGVKTLFFLEVKSKKTRKFWKLQYLFQYKSHFFVPKYRPKS